MTTRRDLVSKIALGSVVAAGALRAAPARADSAGENRLDRIRRTGKMRTAAVVGAEPFFHKDIMGGGWSGACVSMAQDLAKSLGVACEIVDAQWGGAVMDLQSDKIDVMFALSPTPQRGLVVQFSNLMIDNTFTAIVRNGLEVSKWEDLNKPEVRVAFDVGSSHDIFVNRALPKCTKVAVQSPTDTIMALQTGRADCVVQVIAIASVMHGRAPNVGTLIVPQPMIGQPTCVGVPVESDPRWLTYINNWLLYSRSEGIIRQWMFEALASQGVKSESLPPGLNF
ncbi:transporter substrate-binding domain-containing protein [Komagataeibacter xylinus]|uniref:transporter substrate-binding domain-containing protein n=1 Tax=Komagataeibacter xylinus TaxID=28448 RepID=UPI00280B464A|nr:transporter substrate-binding domain-containing protein [Komagataeibacter xylinus]